MPERTLTLNQRHVLMYLKRYQAGFHPSNRMRDRYLWNPGPTLARLAKRGLVEAGAISPAGWCYRITPAGVAALEDRE